MKEILDVQKYLATTSETNETRIFIIWHKTRNAMKQLTRHFLVMIVVVVVVVTSLLHSSLLLFPLTLRYDRVDRNVCSMRLA